MSPIETLTLDEIRKLFKKTFGITITRAGIYKYMKTKSFPDNLGLGKPRVWDKGIVVAWMEKQKGKHAD